MAQMNVSLEYKIPEESFKKIAHLIIDEIGSDLLKQVTNDIMNSILSVIFSYMRHTTKHGWNYEYTGKLASSFKESNKPIKIGSVDEVILRNIISSEHPAARILQEGGIIRPKRASRLTVPLPNKYGIDINEARALKESGRLFLRNGKLYFKFQGRAIPLYALKSFVKMPKYRYLSKALRKAGFRPR